MISLEKPRPQPRVHVQVRNPHSKSSRTFTLYNTDVNEAVDAILRLVEGNKPAKADEAAGRKRSF